MRYHIALTNSVAERIRKESVKESKVPQSDLSFLVKSLNASFLVQKSYPVKFIDQIRSKISGTPEIWAFSRTLASQFGSDDLIFCPGEEIGIPLASNFSANKERPKIAVWFHRISGPRGRVALKLFRIAHQVDLFIVSSRANQHFLNHYLNIPDSRILFFWQPLDCNYFRPGDPSSNKTRPVVVSVGLEQRDYRLLAAATEKLDVDVKVSGFSKFHSRTPRNFPKVMPDNMSNKWYELPELIRLYHDADVVVICLKQNISSAGVTALLEAMACRKPIVAVRTQGLVDYLSDEKAIISIEPGDVIGLQKAILYLLDNPQEAQLRAERAYQIVLERHNLEKQVGVLTKFFIEKGGKPLTLKLSSKCSN